MLERLVTTLTALLGIVALAVAFLGALWFVSDRTLDAVLPAEPGDPISEDDQAWLSSSPYRTLVDVDALRADVLVLEAMVRASFESELDVTYHGIGGPPSGSGPMIGAAGTAVVAEVPDLARLLSVGFELVPRPGVAPPTMYPATGPAPSFPYPTVAPPPPSYPTVTPPPPSYPTPAPRVAVLLMTHELGELAVWDIGDLHELRFSVRRDIDSTSFEP